MRLKVINETLTGLNTEFVNTETGRHISLGQAIKQIDSGNKSYSGYQTVTKSDGTVYVRSKADGKASNNIE